MAILLAMKSPSSAPNLGTKLHPGSSVTPPEADWATVYHSANTLLLLWTVCHPSEEFPHERDRGSQTIQSDLGEAELDPLLSDMASTTSGR
jgi:hypothetical protein